MILRLSKAIRKPGKSGPAVFAFYDPRPPLRDFTKNIHAKQNPLVSTSQLPGSRAEGFAQPMSSEPAPSHRPWIGALGATPAHRALPYHAQLQSYTRPTGFFLQVESSFLPNALLGSKTTLEYRNGREQAQTGGCCRSTEFVIVVPRPTWRNIFLKKTRHQQRSHQSDTGRSLGQ